MNINKFLIFLYPIVFSLPELALNIGVINLRFDDIIITLLFLLNLSKIINFRLPSHLKIYFGLFVYATVSIIFVTVFSIDLLVSSQVIKAYGSLPFFFVLPYIFNNDSYRKILYRGAFIGGCIFLFNLFQNYNTIVLEQTLEKFHSLKKEVGFETLNPNAVATFGLILGWINILQFIEYKKKFTLIVGIILLCIPFFIFARSSSIGLIVALLIILFFQRKKLKNFIVIGIIVFTVVTIVLQFIDPIFLKEATKIDIRTGEGFSSRYELWQQGLKLFVMSPIWGHGFTTEIALYSKYFHGQMSHQIFLRYAIDLGLLGLTGFCYFIFKIIKSTYQRYKIDKNIITLVQLSLFIGFLTADMAGNLLYFNKYAYLIFAVTTFNSKLNKKNN